MCVGEFKESQLKHIDLPLDDEDTFIKLLDYLYSGDYCPQSSQSHSDKTGALMKSCASINIMPDKYQVEGLKAKTASKMQLLSGTPATAFFNISKQIYDMVPDPDAVWRTSFKTKARKYLTDMQPTKVEKLLGKLLAGGPMTVDLVQAQCQIIKGFQENHGYSHGVCGKCLK
ncbi:MAG: hypothetical protein FRX48_09799 [Lasallia pustulata]|uniref:BTB domain-containing protein n=1 Tax=Lasallia pustulata TaxID=136370 RepID=A0A5M8PBY3_9LECA|nr:MAG: hypothetical protein FRX48_09799 [Lasallia pustulata]